VKSAHRIRNDVRRSENLFNDSGSVNRSTSKCSSTYLSRNSLPLSDGVVRQGFAFDLSGDFALVLSCVLSVLVRVLSF
jgi:hypothetical protein